MGFQRTPQDEIRAVELRQMQRRATGLLVVVTVAFLAITVLGGDATWVGYAQAAAEGSMVGGLADWFAVTALFRHPLGIPLPHTAVIRERKDQFGATLGSFVQQNFLSPEIVSERVRGARMTERLAKWLTDPEHSELVARHVTETMVSLADAVREEDVNRVMGRQVEEAVLATPLAPLAGRALRFATADGRHQELFDVILAGAAKAVEEQREELKERFGNEAPWWLPGAVEDRIFDRLVEGVRGLVDSVATNPDHELRRVFDQRVEEFAQRLEHDPELLARGEQLKRDMLAQPELRAWTASLWQDGKAILREQAEDPQSRLRLQVASTVAKAGERLVHDTSLSERADSLAERFVRTAADQFHDEISDLITGTVERWDAEETSDKLELLLGRDLQFIRINGTVVGALAGMAIHAVATAAG